MNERREIFIVAGEPSGDMIGSLLIKRLLRADPDLKIAAIGGEQMQAAGAELRFNIVRDLAIIGIVEVFTKFGRIYRLFRETQRYLRERRPSVLVVIDYPGFNLRIARYAHRLGIRVVYYVTPQVWAWHKSRVKRIARDVDRALVVLPFEEEFLRKHGARAEYVGHPLLDIMILTMNREEVFERFGLDPRKKLIGLLPGSRKREVEKLLPIMLEAAGRIASERPDVQFVLPRAATIDRDFIDGFLRRSPVPVTVVESFRYNVRAAMDFAIVASGTATLETGLLLTPMVILYKIAWPSWMMAQWLVDIPYAGLINIIAGEMIAPELLQEICTPENVARASLKVLNDPGETEKIRERLREVKEKMGGPGASRRAAEVVLELMRESESAASEISTPEPALGGK